MMRQWNLLPARRLAKQILSSKDQGASRANSQEKRKSQLAQEGGRGGPYLDMSSAGVANSTQWVRKEL